MRSRVDAGRALLKTSNVAIERRHRNQHFGLRSLFVSEGREAQEVSALYRATVHLAPRCAPFSALP